MDINDLEIMTTYDITDQILNNKTLDLEFMFKNDKSGFRIENEQYDQSDNKSFSFDLYKIKDDEFEIRLEVDKNANRNEISDIIKIMQLEMKYTHLE